MQVSDLVTDLTQRGVELRVDRDKLRVNAPKGVLTSKLRADLAARKAEVLSFLRQPKGCLTKTGLSLATLGRLLGGGGHPKVSSTTFKPPVIESGRMAQQLRVAIRPLPERFNNQTVLSFRDELEQRLLDCGVTIVPWETATRNLQIKGLLGPTTLRVIRADINAVIDVERPTSRLKSWIAEQFYRLYSWFRNRPSVAQISQLTGWAEDHAMHRLEDPTATQVILIKSLDESFIDAPYDKKIAMGVNTLVSGFSEVVIGVSDQQLSILNMNLSDSLFKRSQLEHFVAKSLIPKIYVPIAPLPLSQFELGEYSPQQSEYAPRLVKLSQSLAKTGLFPSGFKLGEVIRRQSHRDIVDAIVNGRTGVSYGFVAYAEPPQYVGEKEISAADWQRLLPVDGFGDDEIRQNSLGRRYIRTAVNSQTVYRQIPDIWLVCSRSGADKTDLKLDCDVLRLGLTGHLQLQLPAGSDQEADIKPSYDTYVMVAIALSAALYTPELIQNGAPMIHFHGYAKREWFSDQEAYAGVENPSVPCGTYESGVFNFLSIHQLASASPLKLAGLVEPDHGINLIAHDMDYLLSRLTEGLQQQQIELGGKHFDSLRQSVRGVTT